MKTKKGILLLSTAMITGMLAGCGGQNVSESATGSSTASSTEEAQKSTDTTSSAASDEKIVLKVLDNYQGGMVENMVSLYETLHPEIDIQYDAYADNKNVYLNDLREDIKADSFPTEKILQNAVNDENCFVVPKVVE